MCKEICSAQSWAARKKKTVLIENFIKFQKKNLWLEKTLIFVSITKCANNILRSQQLGTEQKNKGEIIMQKNMTVLANKFCDDVFEMCLKKCKSLEIASFAEKLVQENYAQLRQYPDIFFNSIKAIFVNSKLIAKFSLPVLYYL